MEWPVMVLNALKIDLANSISTYYITHTDVDECALEMDECQQRCNNTIGSYTCSCSGGYRLQSDGVTCQS